MQLALVWQPPFAVLHSFISGINDIQYWILHFLKALNKNNKYTDTYVIKEIDKIYIKRWPLKFLIHYQMENKSKYIPVHIAPLPLNPWLHTHM